MKKIISRRDLAIALERGAVPLESVGKSLKRTIELWLFRKEINHANGMLMLINK